MSSVSTASISAQLAAIVGADNLIDGLDQRTFFSTDIAKRGETVLAVARPGTTEQVSQIVAACTAQGIAVVPRGGGFSYTGGYTPAEPDSVTIDMRGLDRVVEINEEDMYVRVETGCTWRVLYETLKARGLRTPYYGPMSGYNATVGGALSQGSFFLGSTEYGTTAETVLSLEVVLANGDVIHTGSDSAAGVGPFFRPYGPDLTGLFLADTGAMGFKTVATLKLIRFPQHQGYGSFAFDSGPQAMAALSEIGRAGLAAEAYAWDPYFVKIMSEATTSTKQDLAFLWAVIRNSAGIVDGLTAGLRIALSGKRVFREGTHIIQIMIDDHSAAGAAERLKKVRAIAMANGATELAPSVPRAIRGTPFTDFNVPERRTTLRNLPINSIYPHSRAPAALKAIRALLAENQAEIDRHGMNVGVVFFAVGKNAMCIEPILYWHDEQHFHHNRLTERSDVEAIDKIGERPAATLFAMELREKLKAVMKANGAVHVQIGKAYNYLPSREPRVAELVRAVKASVDPDRRINPGALGL
ncbi:FAD-binding oxidoreductase [Sphingobium aromaticivastans]|uniref:FAD-binding oxidoreductase n=1 Tax=Sphingobium aromaticivastans TaxID=1778665 RepID=UPI0030193301